MIRAVLDANVIASGVVGFLILVSTPGRLLRAWQTGQFELLVSDHLLAEVGRTLQKSYFRARVTADRIAHFEEQLVQSATHTVLTETVEGVATHPEDDLVLATAVSAQADYRVTGDRRLIRAVPSYRGVTLVTPREFLEILERDQL
jgi:putative PIN family toxin of toxin-antitoxin system